MTQIDRTPPQPIRPRRRLEGSLRRLVFGPRPAPYRAPGDLPRTHERDGDHHPANHRERRAA